MRDYDRFYESEETGEFGRPVSKLYVQLADLLEKDEDWLMEVAQHKAPGRAELVVIPIGVEHYDDQPGLTNVVLGIYDAYEMEEN